MARNTNRSLGEGKITKMVKKYAFIMDEHLGAVQFPLAAAQHTEPNCTDLREKFQTDEHVIFTANKQMNNNEVEYRAVSVAKPRELLIVSGKITDIVPNRFCYADVRKYGRIFVPFSARLNMTQKHWLGRGAEKNREVVLRIFLQPQINGCSYVAYSISLPGSDGIVDGPPPRTATVDSLTDQIGIIVEVPAQPNGDLKVFSHVSGFARLPGAFRKQWMSLGRHIRYDAVKQQHVSQDKIHWVVRKCTDLGQLFKKVDENPLKPDSLILEIHAVINRVAPNPPNRCAWFWNDFIGRIYCYSHNYVAGMNVMECIKCKVVYTGAFDDVPWSAYDIELLGDDDDARFVSAQMLLTRDDWTVTYADRQKISFIGFLECSEMAPPQCFLAWTDLADSDAPPLVGQRCRATVYYQIRKDKHQWRAVLITPLNPNGMPTSNHPLYSGSRQLIWPDPVDPPIQESASPTAINSPGPGSSFPPGLQSFNPLDNVLAPIGTGMRPYNHMVKMNSLAKQESSSSVLSMGSSNGLGERNGSFSHVLTPPPHPAAGFAMPGLVGSHISEMPPLAPLDDLSFNHLTDSTRSSPMANGASSQTSESNFMHMFTNGWYKGHKQDVFQAFQPAANNGSYASPSNKELSTCDQGSQTEMTIEHQFLRDVLKNPDCFKVIIDNFPNHFERIMSIMAMFR